MCLKNVTSDQFIKQVKSSVLIGQEEIEIEIEVIKKTNTTIQDRKQTLAKRTQFSSHFCANKILRELWQTTEFVKIF